MSKKAFTPKLQEISVFFPCYNEAANLPTLLESAIQIVPSVAHKYEIIIVNDGSTDNTRSIAARYVKKYPFVRLINQENQGYGGAVNTGFKAAKYAWVFFTDADLQFDLNELKTFVKKVRNADLVIGYRKNRAEGFKRSLFARGMKLWNFLWLGMPLSIKDIDCAFKLIKKDVLASVGELNARGNLVSTEFLLAAYKSGYKFKQVGVTHFNRQFGVSKCGNVKDIFKVIRETFLLRALVKEHLAKHIMKYPYKVRVVPHV